jgi:hypothetical protein
MPIQQILLADAKPGMIVAIGVTNAKGMMLCAAGTMLTDVTIERLGNMGVVGLQVEVAEGLAESEYEARRAALELTFGRVAPESLLGRLGALMRGRLESARNG